MYVHHYFIAQHLLGKGKLYKTGQWTYTYIKNEQFRFFSMPYLKKETGREQVS